MNCKNCGAPKAARAGCEFCGSHPEPDLTGPEMREVVRAFDPATEAPLQTLHGKNQTPPIKAGGSTGKAWA